MQSNGEDKSGLPRRSERGLIRSQQAWNPHERKIRVTSCNYAFSQTTSCCPQHEPKLPPYLQHAMGDEGDLLPISVLELHCPVNPLTFPWNPKRRRTSLRVVRLQGQPQITY
jgi:hypothetical protein